MKTFLHYLLMLVLFIFSVAAKAQVPVMSSYPSAAATIFLDFDGHLVEGTSWNFNGPVHCGPSNLTNAQMIEIFNRVAEDYRPFNVNVTTDSTKYISAPATQRIRVIHTVSYEWYGSTAGGVSFYGAFTWGDNTPSFVFTSLLNYNTKFIAEAATHEAGHSLGLRHQSSYDATCAKVAEYNSGTGSGEIGWAPIMGVGYYRNQTLWNNGSDPLGCNSIQNDLQVITTSNGFGYRVDDNNGSFGGNGTQLQFSGNQFSVSGVIERSTDVDVFRFSMPITGRFTLNAIPFSAGPDNSGANLDVQIELMTNSNNVIGVYNPAQLLHSFIDTTLNAGNYFLRVQSKGNINAPQFASLGSYSLEAKYSSAALPLRRLELQGRVVNNAHALHWTIDADERVVGQTIEISADGRNFTSAAVPQPTERMQTLSATDVTSFYRLHVQFDNGKHYYSNVVMLRESATVKPHLVTNHVQQQVMVNAPSAFGYQVADFSGKIISKGQVQKGISNIDCSKWSGGYYIVHFSNGSDQFSYKLMKQ